MAREQSPEQRFILPGGLIEEDGRRLETAELRPLTGLEEEWLATHPGTANARSVTRLLTTCLVRVGEVSPSLELVRRLLVGDRDYLMLQLRRLTLGDKISAVLVCPACGAKMDVDFNAEEIAVEQRPQTTGIYTLHLAGRPLRFRLPTGGDQEAVLDLDPDHAVDAILDRCLVDQRSEALTAEERHEVIEAMEQRAPRIDLELDLTCPECRHAFLAPFDTTAFFLQEMRINGDQLLREVHLLALYYHWSQAEILGLQRDRRRAYLALLRDALRQE